MAEVKMPPIKSNSDKARAERAAGSKMEKITSGKLRKKSLGMKFAEVFFEGDLQSAVSYMINDIAIPQIKNAVVEGLKVIFYGNSRGGSDYRTNNAPYNSYYVGAQNRNTPKTQPKTNKEPKKFDPRLITIEDRGTAERVLAEMKQHIREYGQVSVSDLFAAVDIISDWTSENYGWMSLDEGKVRACSDGFWLDLPDPYPID